MDLYSLLIHSPTFLLEAYGNILFFAYGGGGWIQSFDYTIGIWCQLHNLFGIKCLKPIITSNQQFHVMVDYFNFLWIKTLGSSPIDFIYAKTSNPFMF